MHLNFFSYLDTSLRAILLFKKRCILCIKYFLFSSYTQENFDIGLRDKTTILCIDVQMRKEWKRHKYKLYSYFKRIRGIKNVELAKKKRYPDLNEDQQKDWEILYERWCTGDLVSLITFLLLNIY